MNYARLVVMTVAARILIVTPAFSQDQPDCSNQQTQMDMTACAGLEFEKADAALNDVWDDAKTNAENSDETGAESKALLTAQRSWLAFRDSQCVMEGLAAAGGSMQPMLVALCNAQMTTDRVKQLRAYIDGLQ
jgi:uncharacterized protein YecT (DUF1311 family)